MKYSTLLFLVTLTFSCVPRQNETPALAQQPKLKKQAPASTIMVPLTQNDEKLDKGLRIENNQVVVGDYAGWLNTAPKSNGYGVISIETIDEKINSLSLSTLFFGKRKTYKLPYQMNEGKLGVNTKKFNFSLKDTVLTIDLIDGMPQSSAVEMFKLKAFKYNTSTTINVDHPVLNELNREPISDGLKNASAALLVGKDVENFNATDLEIMKHGIYARHGIAFEDPRMTDFFSENDWYTPIFTMGEALENLTTIETKNILLLNRFEQHAERYYEDFGR